jgi:hypothetical protein
MSLSVASDLGWRLQRDMLGMSSLGGANIPPPIAAGRVAPAATESPDSASGDSANDSGASSSALAQQVQSFMQVLFEALSNGATSPDPSAGNANGSGSIFSPPSLPIYSRGSVASYRSNGYQQGPKGLQGKIQQLISALGDPSEASGSAVGSLRTAFTRLLQDLDASGASIAPGVSGGSSGLTLRSWLSGLQQNLQQPGATAFSTLGNMVDVVV